MANENSTLLFDYGDALALASDDALSGPKLWIRQGVLMYISWQRAPKDGDIVLIQQGNDEFPVFRRLATENGAQILQATNPNYPNLPVAESTRILGVVTLVVKSLIEETAENDRKRASEPENRARLKTLSARRLSHAIMA